MTRVLLRLGGTFLIMHTRCRRTGVKIKVRLRSPNSSATNTHQIDTRFATLSFIDSSAAAPPHTKEWSWCSFRVCLPIDLLASTSFILQSWRQWLRFFKEWELRQRSRHPPHSTPRNSTSLLADLFQVCRIDFNCFDFINWCFLGLQLHLIDSS